ncbi:GIY-YIG nuclease family protein [Clostridium tagluense]|uniref:GIY-YIG nuclease family protein n=1 Tax=Clostridium tagluense TaxID=360422 RepID=UPI001CF4AAB6|nr:GIY-YIG nuclease family protein [Clostridium tagluense]MCB2297054.1 GIY-YIG nuclease family protein [Clostridium tagluense]
MAMSKEERKIYRHNYYIEHMEIEKAQMKVYQANNPEFFKEYRENNAEYLNEYSKEYRENNADAIKRYRKQFYEKHRRDATYLLIDKNLKVLYTGSTSNVYKRINEKHMTSWSNLHLTKERWNELECSHFEYCYLDGLQNKQERLYIEKMLIEKYNSTLNQDEPIKDTSCITEDRKAELEIMADNCSFKIWNR